MAGVELATAYYSLVPSMAGTAAAVRSQSGSLTGAWNSIGDDAGSGVKRGLLGGVLAAGAGIVAGIAALGIGNLIQRAVQGIGDSVDIASSLEETNSAIKQVFGSESAGLVTKWASQGAGALGTSRLAALQAAQSFGVYGKAAGLAGTDLAGFSTDLAGLGTDLASFFDTSPEEAIQAIGAGLRGESEPLRRFGVLLDDATLRARAMAMGIYDGNGSLTQQQRVLAAQAEIFAQSADAQGDFERTSGSLSNQQKTLAGNFEDVKAKLGESLLPAMTMFATFANDKLVPILSTLAEQVGPMLGDALTKAAPAFEELLTAIVPLLPELVRAGAEILPALITGFVAITPALVDITSNTASAFATMNAFFSFLKGDTSLGQIMDSVFAASGSISEFAKGAVTAVMTVSAFFRDMASNVGSAVGTAIGFVMSLPGRIQGAFSGAGSWLVGVGRDIFSGLIRGLQSMVGSVISAVTGPINDAIAGAKSLLGIHSPSRVFEEIGVQTALGFEKGMVKMTPQVQSVSSAMVAAPSVSTSPTAGGGFPSTVVLRIGDRDFNAYVDELAGAVVGSYDKQRSRATQRGSSGF